MARAVDRGINLGQGATCIVREGTGLAYWFLVGLHSQISHRLAGVAAVVNSFSYTRLLRPGSRKKLLTLRLVPLAFGGRYWPKNRGCGAEYLRLTAQHPRISYFCV